MFFHPALTDRLRETHFEGEIRCIMRIQQWESKLFLSLSRSRFIIDLYARLKEKKKKQKEKKKMSMDQIYERS